MKVKEIKVNELEMKEFFEVSMDENNRKVINRLGYFARVRNEETPYVWFEHTNPVVDIDAAPDVVYEQEEPGNILMMSREMLRNKLASFKGMAGLNILDVSSYTPCGVYCDVA
jgi:hypothetical protein